MGKDDEPLIGYSVEQARVHALLTQDHEFRAELTSAVQALISHNTRVLCRLHRMTQIKDELIRVLRTISTEVKGVAARVPDNEANDLLRLMKRVEQTADDYEKYA